MVRSSERGLQWWYLLVIVYIWSGSVQDRLLFCGCDDQNCCSPVQAICVRFWAPSSSLGPGFHICAESNDDDSGKISRTNGSASSDSSHFAACISSSNIVTLGLVIIGVWRLALDIIHFSQLVMDFYFSWRFLSRPVCGTSLPQERRRPNQPQRSSFSCSSVLLRRLSGSLSSNKAPERPGVCLSTGGVMNAVWRWRGCTFQLLG